MKVTELKNTESEFEAKISIPFADIETQVEKEIAKVAKTAKMPGFRVGKVPMSILKKRYAPSVRFDAVNNKISEAIGNVIQDKKLRTSGDPKITDLVNEEKKDLEFKLSFELLPEIKMPDFKKISVEKAKLKVEDKDVKEHLERLAKMSKDYSKESKVKAKKDEQVTIDAVGYVDGKAFDGGKLDAHKLVLGSGTFIPGFEDQLIGTKAGDEVSVNVEFPKDYHATNLAGKPAEFKVKVLAVHKSEEAKIDDELAKKFKCENLEDLKTKITSNLEEAYNEPARTMMKMKLFDKLEDMLTFDVPASILDREKQALKQQTEQSKEEDSELKGKSDKEIDSYYKKLALRRVRLGLMLAEYVKIKNIQITQDDLRASIINQAKMYPAQSQQIIEFYQKNQNAVESLKGPILEEKAVQNIFDHEIKITEKAYPKDKLDKLLESE